MNNLDLIKDENAKSVIEKFKEEAIASGKPFFDISNLHLYRYVWWEWWYNNGFGKLFNIGKVYNPHNIIENAVALYSRTKPRGTAQGTVLPDFDISPNNGGAENYRIAGQKRIIHNNHMPVDSGPGFDTCRFGFE